MKTSFADAIKYSMIDYHSLYATAGQFFDQVFLTNGNGYCWHNGVPISRDGGELAALPALERAAANPTQKTRSIPSWLRYPIHYDELPTNIPERTQNPVVLHCYGYSKGYNMLEKIPDNVDPIWLNAAITYIIAVANAPIENFSFSGYNNRLTQDELAGVKRQFEETKEAMVTILADLQKRFPDHVYNNPLKAVTYDPNRPDVDGPRAWPLDGSTVSVQDLIYPFIDALKFAYNITLKDSSKDLEDTLEKLFVQVYEAAVELGQRIIADEVLDTYEMRKDRSAKNVVRDICKKYPNSNGAQVYLYDSIIQSLMTEFHAAFNLNRKNKAKDIPYIGYPNGCKSRAGCLEPEERLSAESMKYDEEDQGRDGLEVIIGTMTTVVSEQGSRMVIKDLLDVAADLPVDEFDSIFDRNERRGHQGKPEQIALVNAALDKAEGKTIADIMQLRGILSA